MMPTIEAVKAHKYMWNKIILFLILVIDRSAYARHASVFVPTYKSRSNLSSTTVHSSSRLPLIEAPSLRASNSISNRIDRFTKSNVLVQIERTAQNERRISGELTLNHDIQFAEKGSDSHIGIDHLWDVLTDYENLSTHVPNLVESRIVNKQGNHRFERRGTGFNSFGDKTPNQLVHEAKSGPRIYQRGAQKIWGFEFGADLTMDTRESVIEYTEHHQAIRKKCILDFKCVSSPFFQQFDGSWIIEESTLSSINGSLCPITSVKYIVNVRPKGMVPVAALEWRIKEDVPTNMLGIVNAASKKLGLQLPGALNSDISNNVGIDWYKDETLSMYL